MENRKVCVYCGSSRQCNATYLEAAKQLGQVLARNNFTVVYGGGAAGSMNSLAEGVLAEGGRLVGVIPEFMVKLEWANPRLPETIVVNDMHERKKRMIDGVDAVIALPGGCGTLEELMEAITWKRLGLFLGAIVILNTQSFYQPLIRLLDQCIGERFMDSRHAHMWSVVGEPEDVPQAISGASPWNTDCRSFATLR